MYILLLYVGAGQNPQTKVGQKTLPRGARYLCRIISHKINSIHTSKTKKHIKEGLCPIERTISVNRYIQISNEFLRLAVYYGANMVSTKLQILYWSESYFRAH